MRFREIPAYAGMTWVAGMTWWVCGSGDSRLRGNDVMVMGMTWVVRGNDVMVMGMT